MRVLVLQTDAQRERAVLILSKIPIPPVKQITIEDYQPKRSTQQNRRYWLVVQMVAKHTGHDPDEIHDFFKEKFLGTRVVEIAGERATVRPSTKRLKVKDFKLYMDKCEDWAIEHLGLFLDGSTL